MKIEIKKDEKNYTNKTACSISFTGHLQDGSSSVEELEAVEKAFAAAGVSVYSYVDEKSGIAYVKFSTEENSRSAGRKRSKTTRMHLTQIEAIVLMNGKKDSEIIKEMGLSESTYFRLKRKLKSSDVYKAIERDGRLEDSALLSSDVKSYTAMDGTVYRADYFA